MAPFGRVTPEGAGAGAAAGAAGAAAGAAGPATAAVLAGVYERAGQDPPFPAGQLAELLAALGSGAQLEHAANPAALPASFRAEVLGRLLAARNAAGPDDAT